MARTSSDSSSATFDWGDTTFTDGVDSFLVTFWLNVASFTANYQTYFSKDDYPTNVAGWGFQRHNNTDAIDFFTRGPANFVLGAGTGFQGSGWVHIAAFAQTSPSNLVKTYRNGSLQDSSTAINIGNPFGNNTAALTIAGIDNNSAVEGFAVWTSLSETDADDIAAALALGFEPIAMHKRPAFYAPLVGYGTTEPDLMGQAAASTVPANSATVAGPRMFRPFRKPAAQPVLVAAVFASASNSMAFSGTATNNVDFAVFASNSIIVSADTHNTDIGASASNSMAFSVSASATIPVIWNVSASNAMTFSVTVGLMRAILMSARSSVIFTQRTSSYTSPILVSAGNSFTLKGQASALGPIFVSARSSMKFATSLALRQLKVYRVTASNAIAIKGKADVRKLAILYVSASNGLALSSSATAKRTMVVSASNGLALSSTAKQRRDIYVGATTSMGISSSPGSNNFYAEDASSTVAFTVSAGVILSATEASNSLALSSFAWATVEFPWRRTQLTLDPGGGLPHSG